MHLSYKGANHKFTYKVLVFDFLGRDKSPAFIWPEDQFEPHLFTESSLRAIAIEQN